MKRKSLRLQGKTFFMDQWSDVKLQKMIETGEPKITGDYICFYKVPNDAWDWMPMAHTKVARWQGGKWWCGEQVLGFIGPLPNMSLDELHGMNPDSSSLLMFFKSTKENGKKMQFDDGPYMRIFSASAAPGEKGEYIFLVDSRKTKAIPFRKWSVAKKKWVDLPAAKRMKNTIQNKTKTTKRTKLVSGMKRGKKRK